MRFPLALLFLPLLAATGAPLTPPTPRSGTEKVEISLVLIDVIVRDRKETPIRGLTRDDFEMTVDAKPVDPSAIEVFEEVCVPPEDQPEQPPLQGAGSTTAEAPAPPAQERALLHMVVYLDFSQLSMAAHRKSILAARDHLAANMGPSDRTMILAYMKGLRLVQDFTGDRDLLVSRLDAMLDDRATLDTDALEEAQNMVDVAQNLPRKSAALAYAAQEGFRVRGSLNALASVMPRLAGLRGRKALVLFTDLLKDDPGAQYLTMLNTTPKSEGMVDVLPDILRVTREANAAGVSIYTVHAAGLDEHPVRQLVSGYKTSPFVSADTLEATIDPLLIGEQVVNGAGVALTSALALQGALALETGGRSLQRTNDLAGVMRSARQDLSCYYLLGYSHAGPGDDSQHQIVLKLKDDPDRPRGLTVRYRPSFTDRSDASRRDRMLRSALEVPEFYKTFHVALEAYALAPQSSKRGVLIKTVVPLEGLSLIPDGEVHKGRLEIRGSITRERETVCDFKQDIAIRRRAEERLVYQTGCMLPAGSYDLTVAVLDRGASQAGARRVPLRLESMGAPGEAHLGEVHLWARDSASLVVTSGAEDIGIPRRAGSGDFTLRSERRLAVDQPGVFSFLFCPASDALGAVSTARPIAIQMRVLSGDRVVSDDEVRITGPSEMHGSTCHEIRRNLPPSSLPAGNYTLDIAARGTGSPIARRADFAVE